MSSALSASAERDGRIAELIRRLADTDAELRALLSDEVDAVVDPRFATPLLLQGAQAALRESEERYRFLAEVMPTQVWTATAQGEIDYVNQRLLAYAGMTLEELARSEFPNVHPDDDAAVLQRWRECRASGVDFEHAARLRRHDDVYRWHLCRASAQRDPAGAVIRWIGTNSDIEDEREVEALAARTRELEAARLAAERANRARSEFFANLSHELRTPINAIIGYTELLDLGISGTLNAVQREQLSRIQISGRHMLTLINNVLDVAKYEAGQLDVMLEHVDLGATIQQALAIVQHQALQGGITLVGPASAQPDMCISADEARIRQILTNLLSNAVKFSVAGATVRVGIEAMDAGALGAAQGDADRAWILVHVEDTGAGIPEATLDSIFEPFVQVDGRRTSERAGTGLGLTISRQLARLMGGDLTVRSTLGAGSRFTLWLPADT